jgi:hypothetical protein
MVSVIHDDIKYFNFEEFEFSSRLVEDEMVFISACAVLSALPCAASIYTPSNHPPPPTILQKYRKIAQTATRLTFAEEAPSSNLSQ